MKANHPAFADIPMGDTLLSFGDCFLADDASWKISCFFKSLDHVITKVDLPAETISSLGIGRSYGNGFNTIGAAGMEYLPYLRLPPVSSWEKLTMADVPAWLYKPYSCEECWRQKVYKISYKERIVWIPVIELARYVFFKTFLISHCAFYEPNLHTLASIEFRSDKSVIRLAKRYPKSLLDSVGHLWFLAHLLLDPDNTRSFCSIYKSKYFESFYVSKSLHWVFDFDFIEENMHIDRCYAYEFGDQIFIGEIQSASGPKIMSGYASVIVEHPSDVFPDPKRPYKRARNLVG